MEALIRETRKQNLELLKEIIENCIKLEQKICVQVEVADLCIRNVIRIDDYELDENYFYIYYENFETHINLDDDVEVICSDNKESFLIKKGNIEISFDIVPSNLH